MRRVGWRNVRAGHGRAVTASIAAILFASGFSACTAGPGARGEVGTEAVEVSVPVEASIVGRWQLPTPANQDAYVEFGPEGTFSASDGCNSVSGGWQLADDGAFNSKYTAMTQVGCDNDPVPEAVGNAVTAKVAGGELTLTDDKDNTTKLLRTGEAKATLIASWVGPASTTSTSLVGFNADGTWRGTTECSVYEGTWQVKFTSEDSVLQAIDPQGEPATMMMTAGTPLLRIGPAPVRIDESCIPPPGAAQPMFALNYDTKYQLFITATHLSLLRVDGSALTTQPVQFVKASEQLKLPPTW